MNIPVYNKKWELDFVSWQEKYYNDKAYKLAVKIDEKMSLVVKKRPWWCPEILYKKIIRDSIEIISQT